MSFSHKSLWWLFPCISPHLIALYQNAVFFLHPAPDKSQSSSAAVSRKSLTVCQSCILEKVAANSNPGTCWKSLEDKNRSLSPITFEQIYPIDPCMVFLSLGKQLSPQTSRSSRALTSPSWLLSYLIIFGSSILIYLHLCRSSHYFFRDAEVPSNFTAWDNRIVLLY